jgi:hypothetical protein
LRFAGPPARLATCPFCARPVAVLQARDTMGFRLFGHEDGAGGLDALAAAVAALPPPPAPFA